MKTILVVDLNDVYDSLEKLLGIEKSNIGAWNAPKDIPTFEIDLTDLNSYCGYLTGESCFIIKDYYLDIPTQEGSFKNWVIPMMSEDFLEECATKNPKVGRHYHIPIFLALEYLVINNILKRGEEIWLSYSW